MENPVNGVGMSVTSVGRSVECVGRSVKSVDKTVKSVSKSVQSVGKAVRSVGKSVRTRAARKEGGPTSTRDKATEASSGLKHFPAAKQVRFSPVIPES